MQKQQEITSALLAMLDASEILLIEKADHADSLQAEVDRLNMRINTLSALLQSHAIEIPKGEEE